MTDSYFAIRSRFREVRWAVRQSKELLQPSKDGNLIFRFLEDLALSIQPAGSKRDDIVNYVFRCMAEVAMYHADKAYAPYGLESPFKSTPQSMPVSSSAKEFIKIWPIIHDPPNRRNVSKSDIVIGNIYSPLKMFGYTVGKTKGWDKAKRQRFLVDFMEMDLPKIVDEIFGDDYGNPRTVKRLLKVANVIAGVGNLFVRNDAHAYRHAIQDWKDDLQFLKERYYIGSGYPALMWPSLPARNHTP